IRAGLLAGWRGRNRRTGGRIACAIEARSHRDDDGEAGKRAADDHGRPPSGQRGTIMDAPDPLGNWGLELGQKCLKARGLLGPAETASQAYRAAAVVLRSKPRGSSDVIDRCKRSV